MKKTIFIIMMTLSLSVPFSASAGFWSSVAGGLVANSISGTGGGSYEAPTSATSNAKAYFIVLNNKVKELTAQVIALAGFNLFMLIMLIVMFFNYRGQKKKINKLMQAANFAQ